jgi:hypothetical protein
MVHVKVAVVQVLVPSWNAVAVYEVMAEPPEFSGADQDRATWVLPRTPFTPVGAFGAVAGVTALDGLDGVEVPAMLVAVTMKV